MSELLFMGLLGVAANIIVGAVILAAFVIIVVACEDKE